MRSRRSTRAGAASIAALLVTIVLVLAACGSQAGIGDSGGDEAAGVVAGQPRDQQAAEPPGEQSTTGGGPDSPEGYAAPIEQRIIKTGEVMLEVGNVAESLGRVRALAAGLGGHVGSSQAGTLDESASLTLRVPADRFDELLARLHELDSVEVLSEWTSEEDVTREVVDLAARISNLEASEATYRVLLDRAERIDDVLAVQSRLDQVRGEIEQLEGQLKTIEGQADLSTLSVVLIPHGQPVAAAHAAWDPGGQLESAFAALVGLAQGIGDAMIWLVIVWVPVLLLLGLIGLVLLRAALELRRRWPVRNEHREAGPMS
ncbi:MAG TPA: DUF4349 domain-containing protein [Candidatus Binatia bacterium]|nr:DUF4349 domain-containing protein [Candidatus Binatia bacterium]